MSFFSRTTSGIANYHLFHGTDFTVFIEGKTAINRESSNKITDTSYYEYILKCANPSKKPKIKCIGNKVAALEYAKMIREGNIKHTIVIVDKDLEGVTSSPLDVFPVIRTVGYSWENELWTFNTVMAVLNDLTNSPERIKSELDKNFEKFSERLKYLSSLDAAMQTNGASLLDKKKSLGGISFEYPEIPFSEIKRLTSKYKKSGHTACKIAKSIFQAASTLEAMHVIQGHLWTNMTIKLSSSIYKKITGDLTPPNTEIFINMALSHLRRNPVDAVGSLVIEQYSLKLQRFGI